MNREPAVSIKRIKFDCFKCFAELILKKILLSSLIDINLQKGQFDTVLEQMQKSYVECRQLELCSVPGSEI